jgi:hypothetical protein
MPINKNRDLYSFQVDIPRETTKEVEVEKNVEVEKEVEKKRRRKNKETGKMESYTEKVIESTTEKRIVTEERTVTEDTPVKIVFRRPTRTQLEDGDMFYSIWLNKYIKMGLLTRAMLAKQHIDVGGTMDEEEKQYYSQMYVKLFEKQMALQRFAIIGTSEMSIDKLSSIATIWYMSGVQEQEDFDTLLEEISDDVNLDESIPAESREESS